MPHPHQANNLYHCQRKQHGAALLVMLVIMVLGAATFLVSSLSRSALQIERDQKTSESLAQAKQALIGFSASVNLSSGSRRPGDLPCPDMDNDGIPGDATYTTCNLQSQRIGRLPWKTLGLPDLRDGSGERLWYAVSTNFKNSTRSGTLNSDTAGTITVRSSDGNIINDASLGNGVAAAIIAPGDVLQRTDQATAQDRSSAGINNPQNYLEVFNDYLDKINSNYPHTLIYEDNANFTDSSSTDGFIQGRIKIHDPVTNTDNVILNDQLLIITQDNIMQAVQKRVAGEVKKCLEDYALNNNGRYPWAAPITDLDSTYNDSTDNYFGRIPDDLFNTRSDSWDGSSYQMSDQWGTCNTHISNTPIYWWTNWKEMVFYGVSRRFRPRDTTASSFPSICEASTTNCLKVDTSNIHARFVVIVAGKKLSTPDQADRNLNKSNAFYYLEGGNEGADPSIGYNFFYQGSPSSSFNDILIYQ